MSYLSIEKVFKDVKWGRKKSWNVKLHPNDFPNNDDDDFCIRENSIEIAFAFALGTHVVFQDRNVPLYITPVGKDMSYLNLGLIRDMNIDMITIGWSWFIPTIYFVTVIKGENKVNFITNHKDMSSFDKMICKVGKFNHKARRLKNNRMNFASTISF